MMVEMDNGGQVISIILLTCLTLGEKLSFQRRIKKRARFQKYDSKEPGGVKSTTVEIKVIIWQMKKKNNIPATATTAVAAKLPE